MENNTNFKKFRIRSFNRYVHDRNADFHLRTQGFSGFVFPQVCCTDKEFVVLGVVEDLEALFRYAGAAGAVILVSAVLHAQLAGLFSADPVVFDNAQDRIVGQKGEPDGHLAVLFEP